MKNQKREEKRVNSSAWATEVGGVFLMGEGVGIDELKNVRSGWKDRPRLSKISGRRSELREKGWMG